jgi:hypothetical protein
VATFVLDLNDAELRIGAEGRTVAQTAGFALILPSGLLFGEDAVRQFRLHPRQANNVFWHRLDTDALAVLAERTHADILQLLALAKRREAGTSSRRGTRDHRPISWRCSSPKRSACTSPAWWILPWPRW